MRLRIDGMCETGRNCLLPSGRTSGMRISILASLVRFFRLYCQNAEAATKYWIGHALGTVGSYSNSIDWFNVPVRRT